MPDPDTPKSPGSPGNPDPHDARLGRLRQWRNRPERDVSMRFLATYFKQEVERPHKQLGALGDVWRSLVPADMVGHTRLESLARGILRVTVDSSSRLYQLDRLLRAGLEQQIIQAHRGPSFRRIQLRVAGDGRGEPRGKVGPPQRDGEDDR
ncbi:MAG: DciA family protein [Planctomycetota bacterium]|nr:DciA family protein [Planctomycetota bacterium]